MQTKLIAAVSALLLCISLLTSAQTAGVQLTVDSTGLQRLSYNGQHFIPSPSYYSHIVNSAVFKSPNGTQKPYGYVANALGDTGVPSTRSSGTPGDDCNNPSAAAPTCFKQIYRSGLSDSFIVKMVWTILDSRTAKVDIYVTNSDSVDTLSQISLAYWLGGGATTGGQSHFYIPDLALNNTLFWVVNKDTPVAFISGTTWGSAALYTDIYTSNGQFGSFSTNSYVGTGTTNPVSFLFNLQNFYTAGGLASNTKIDPIPPGQTWHYALYIRFGSTSDTETSLAPEAFATYRATFPYLVNWPDRAPIARWFVGGPVNRDARNPRGYFNDPHLNVSDQVTFSARVLSETDNVITTTNAMNPRPQGILIWDLEGDEFNQYFTYVGNPNKLHDMAPEMDAMADQMFAKLKAAGYVIGMTLRPSNFQTGAVLPATCTSNADTDLQDVFIKTDAPYPYRGYACTAPNTWTQMGANNPWYQTCSWDDATILNNLEAKVSYAKYRWGATMFYVDSTVYCASGGGGAFNPQIFRQLEEDFPGTLFIPEEKTSNDWGSTAPYGQVNFGQYDTPQAAKDIYPQSFSTLADFDGVNFSDPATYNKLLRSVKDGTIFLVDGWWHNPTNASILQVYRDAGISNPTSGSTAVSSSASFSRDLTIAATGSDVKALQQWLNSHSFPVASSGPGSPGNETTNFGALTQAALARWQASVGISPAAGYFGSKTRAYLGAHQ